MRCVARALLLALVPLLPAPALAEAEDEATAQACKLAKATDILLNRVYEDALARAAKDAALSERIKAAQRAWVAFRDAQIALLYPAGDPARGSVAPMCTCRTQQELTNERAKQLSRLIAGEEGDVCTWERP
ncbi:MAG: DUF1311 domain-containing protein [bacterium]|nr:DUF1311 domain-containing protein [bacterium]